MTSLFAAVAVAVGLTLLSPHLATGEVLSVLLSESFESGGDDWAPDNGVWLVATSPQFGPAACHAGSKCAATAPDTGNYPTYTSSRLVGPSVALPAIEEGQELQVRFWQWFEYAANHDVGQLQLSVFDPASNTYGQCVGVSTLYSTNSGVWSPVAVDVSTYAGKRVRLCFAHLVLSLVDSRPGWYIDDVEIVRIAPTFTGNFESGWGDWYAENGVWEVGNAMNGPGRCASGSGCAATVLAGQYPPGNWSRLISPSIVLPVVAAGEDLQLRFSHWFSYPDAHDFGQVQVAVVDPATHIIGPWVDMAGYGPTSSSWGPAIVDVAAYNGKRVRFAFNHVTVTIDSAPGWYIDDVHIKGPGYPPTTTSSSSSTSTSSTNTTTSVTGGSSSTTTLPPPQCGAAVGTTKFTAVLCRIDALRSRVATDPGLGEYQVKLPKVLDVAKEHAERAAALCREARTRNARKRLAKTRAKLAQYSQRLLSRRARVQIEESTRQSLLELAGQIHADVSTLRSGLQCPQDGLL